jgi:hypothetical protein
VSGPGSGTSDSIMAWLSNGEFVMRMRAVQKYGLGFMQALNEGRLNLDKPSGLQPRRARVECPVPRSTVADPALRGRRPGCAGGRDAAREHQLRGYSRFDAFMMEEGVRALSKHSNEQRMRRAGKRPSYVGG